MNFKIGFKFWVLTLILTQMISFTSLASISPIPNFSQLKKIKELVFADFFSPNKDGHNDFFVIQNIEEHPINKLFVFNRWGAIVYSAEPYENNWDGISNVDHTFGGNELPEGVYFYRFEYLVGDFVSKSSGKVILKR